MSSIFSIRARPADLHLIYYSLSAQGSCITLVPKMAALLMAICYLKRAYFESYITRSTFRQSMQVYLDKVCYAAFGLSPENNRCRKGGGKAGTGIPPLDRPRGPCNEV